MLDILKDYGSFDKYPYFNLKDTYYLQFNFLPQLFELYEDAKKVFNKFDESKIIDIEFMKKKLNSDNINWENFKFEKKVLPDGLKEFIYDFGIPEKTPLCRYALFFTDDNNIHQYFTLEKKPSHLSNYLKNKISTSTNRAQLSCRKLSDSYFKDTGFKAGKSTINNILRKELGYRYLKTTFKIIF